jgi:hypothetical protein
MSTVKSPRILVKISQVTVTRRRNGVRVDEPVVVKMKASHAKLLGLTGLDGDDPILQGKFGGDAGNKDFKFLRNLGGFRAKAYTLIAKTSFSMDSITKNPDGTDTVTKEPFRSIDIGFPSGVKVVEVYNWLRGLEASVREQIGYIRTPNGRKVDFTNVNNSPAAPAPDAEEPANDSNSFLPGGQ